MTEDILDNCQRQYPGCFGISYRGTLEVVSSRLEARCPITSPLRRPIPGPNDHTEAVRISQTSTPSDFYIRTRWKEKTFRICRIHLHTPHQCDKIELIRRFIRTPGQQPRGSAERLRVSNISESKPPRTSLWLQRSGTRNG